VDDSISRASANTNHMIASGNSNEARRANSDMRQMQRLPAL
jgi:hypothetical protein